MPNTKNFCSFQQRGMTPYDTQKNWGTIELLLARSIDLRYHIENLEHKILYGVGALRKSRCSLSEKNKKIYYSML